MELLIKMRAWGDEMFCGNDLLIMFRIMLKNQKTCDVISFFRWGITGITLVSFNVADTFTNDS